MRGISRRKGNMSISQDASEKKWFAESFERIVHTPLSRTTQRRAADLLTKCDTFDNFMQVRYASVKRYGAEGSESLLPFLDQLFRSSVKAGFEGLFEVFSSLPFVM
jgi:probable 2-oxoglutarate dehydrogenase E1 component DHKTD1